MANGKLEVIKMIGEKPVFCIMDKSNRHSTTIIPDITDWLMKRLGNNVDLFISDIHFQITDLTKKSEHEGE